MSFSLDLNQLRGPRDRLDRTWPAASFGTSDEDFTVAGPVVLRADVERSRDRVRLVGSLEADLSVPCSRCLDAMPLSINTTFDLAYLPQPTGEQEGEREVAEEDLGVAFYEHDSIDLGQLVREQFYLALPMKPLCRPDCQGLCPECGTNLNVAPCRCEHRWQDPRMAALANLLQKDSKGH